LGQTRTWRSSSSRRKRAGLLGDRLRASGQTVEVVLGLHGLAAGDHAGPLGQRDLVETQRQQERDGEDRHRLSEHGGRRLA
jgi:hypothetical protein